MYQTIRAYQVRDGLTNRDEVAGREGWWVDVSGPMLSDEVDMQAWVAERAITKPQGEMNAPAAGPAWTPSDYAEMAAGKGSAMWISEGGRTVSAEKAAERLREAMRFASEPITVSARPSPWDLRGDRVVVPEPDPDPTDGAEEPGEIEAVVARELGTVTALLAVSDANLEAAAALMAASDAQLGRMLEIEEGRSGEARGGVSGEHLGASDSVAGKSRNAVQAAPARPSGVTDVGGDDEDEEEGPPEIKPLVKKPAEPPYRPLRDEWGFPITYPPPEEDGGDEPEEGEEPSPGGEEAEGSHYQSVEPALRAATIQEKGMKTRIQLTGYMAGKYVRGQADNFVVPDVMADAVRDALEPIAEGARARFEAAVASGAVQRKGGSRVRVQLTEYATNGGEYLRQDGSASAPQNLNAPGMTVAEVAALVDHQLATHFGVRRGDAAALVKAWRAFAGEPAAPVIEPEAVVEPARPAGEPPAIVRPDLLGRRYDKAVHGGLCAVVDGARGMRVLSLWGSEADAVVAARRTGARVVDAEGYLVPQADMDAVPEAAPDRPEVRV